MRWLKLSLRVIAGLVVLIAVAALALFLVSNREIHKTYSIAPPSITIPTDSTSLARGQHLATAIGKCAECHGDNFAGAKFVDDPAFGRIYGANLTTGVGSAILRYSDADFARVIRFGIKANGESLIFMPTHEYTKFSDSDLGALIAYLRSIPAVDNTVPKSSLGPIGRMLLVTKKVPEMLPTRFIVLDTKPRPDIPSGVTVEYGQYLANTGGCTGCHGPTLAGGPIPGVPPDWPPAANLTPAGLAGWTEADFTRALREGLRPDNSAISAVMPWKYTRMMTDDEIRAVWLYIQTVPPVPPVSPQS